MCAVGVLAALILGLLNTKRMHLRLENAFVLFVFALSFGQYVSDGFIMQLYYRQLQMAQKEQLKAQKQANKIKNKNKNKKGKR